MKKPSDPIATFTNPTDDWDKWREGILGFGERSSRKTYYAELQRKTEELERFQALLNKSHDAIFLIASESGMIVDVNETASQLSGYGRPALLGMTVQEILDAQIAQQILAGIADQQPNFAHHTITTVVHAHDERAIPVEISIDYVHFGAQAYIVAVARDITERLVIERERDRIFKERNLIIEHVPVGLMFLKNRQIMWSNVVMERLFGYPTAELQGQTTAMLYPSQEDYRAIGAAAYPLLAQGQEYATEWLMQRKDQSVFWCHLHGQAVQTGDVAQGSIWIIEDITERKRLQEAQQRLNEELERRVQERTQELSAAYVKISLLNEQLNDENLRMRTEMDLARQIQTSLLPTHYSRLHPDFEIAAIMRPADEVGGDYYDITLDREGSLWFGIGDVSGHGVTPGLIMMMAQTVHTAITANYQASPQEVVNHINTVLYKNVHERLQEDHFMTFTTLKYLGAGRFQFAGMHLDLIVYRHHNRRCEAIDTPGAWLNMLPDISDVTNDCEVMVEIGDILVLYTDGLTEAQNQQRELLDLPRFAHIIEAHAEQDVETCCEAILQDVLHWCAYYQDDDMSLVVARRVR